MKKVSYIFLLAFALHIALALRIVQTAAAQSPREHCVMFYNTENLFHPSNNSTAADDDFTPGGVRRWNFFRYNRKIAAICKVILAANGWEPPDAVCLSEIENSQVLSDILFHPLMLGQQYLPLHRDSPDHRGIDVGILYRGDRMECLDTNWIEIRDAMGELVPTREILSATFRLKATSDTVVIIANHWTSKYGGALETEAKRMLQSQLLGTYIHTLLNPRLPVPRDSELPGTAAFGRSSKRRISVIAGGDLNDLSGSAPVQMLSDRFHLEEVMPGEAIPEEVRPGEIRPGQVIEALPGKVRSKNIRPGKVIPGEVIPGEALEALSGKVIPREAAVNGTGSGAGTDSRLRSASSGIHSDTRPRSQLHIRSAGSRFFSFTGDRLTAYASYKYQGKWGSIDHVFVGGILHAQDCRAEVFSLPQLLEEDVKYTGKKPFRTYNGFSYQGGVSDHLPLLLYFVVPD